MARDSNYKPPYESPLEDIFAYNAAKYFNSSVFLRKQVEFKTICGTFRMDFLAATNTVSIGIECDGKKYHNKSRDEWRDAMILGELNLSAIFRLRGNDLFYRMDDCLFLLSKWYPVLFSKRGLINLKALASNDVKGFDFKTEDTSVIIPYTEMSNSNDPIYLTIERHAFTSDRGKKSFLKQIYEFAKSQGGDNLDSLIAKYRENWQFD